MNHNQYFRDFLKYVSLNVLGMIGLSCYILADTFFISKGLGTKGLTALNLAIPIYSFIHGTGLMIGIGGATKYSILKSLHKKKEASLQFTHAICLAGAFAAFFVSMGLFYSRSLTASLGADSQVFEMTNTYLKVILLFAPAFLLNQVFISFIRNDGNPKLSMMGMLLGSFSNILLDYIFIFPLDMGIFGAVLATGFAPVISMGVLSRHYIKKRHHFHFIRERLRIRTIASILSLGFPSLITEVSSGVVIIIFNTIILRLQGNVGVAAYGVIANISLVVLAIYTGMGQGIQPLMSRAYGRGDTRNIRCVLRWAMIAMACVSLVIYGSIFFFAQPITGIFNSEHNMQLQQIAVTGLRLYFTAILFAGFNIVMSVFFTSTEKALPAHIISLLRGLILIIPLAFLLSGLMGLTGVWIAFPVTEALTALVATLLYKSLRKPSV